MSHGFEARSPGTTHLFQAFAALSVALLLLLAYVPLKSYQTDWRATQEHYNLEAAKQKLPPVEIKVQQIFRPELGVVDRCGSCHLAAAGIAAPLPGGPPFAAHPPIPHDPHELGCTTCHLGQGRGTTREAAHGLTAHWEEPLLERGTAEAGCGTCHSNIKVPRLALAAKGAGIAEQTCFSCHKIGAHGKADGPELGGMGLRGFRSDWHAWHIQKSNDAKEGLFTNGFSPLADDEVGAVEEYLRTLIGAPRLLAGKALAHSLGCRGCHKINGVGGDDGPDLSDEGRKVASDLDTRHLSGPKTLRSWLKAHFLDPAKVSEGSRMPNLALTASQADSLSLYMLSLRQRAIPEALAPHDRIRTLRLGEREFATDGASLYGVFCAGCHGETGEGRKLEPKRSSPAIWNPELLAIGDDAFLRRVLNDGRPGRRMPAWATNEGGLRPEEIEAVVGFLRSKELPPPALEAVEAAPLNLAAGQQTFAERCAPCHGVRGEGSPIGPPIAASDDPATTADDRIYGTLSFGVAGTAMGSFRSLDAAAMHGVIAAVRALPRISDVSRTAWSMRIGDPIRGQQFYLLNCARCHGAAGEGPEAPALSNPAFLKAMTDGQIAGTIIRGRPSTLMPTFGVAAADHAKLAPTDVADIIGFIRSWAPKPAAPH